MRGEAARRRGPRPPSAPGRCPIASPAREPAYRRPRSPHSDARGARSRPGACFHGRWSDARRPGNVKSCAAMRTPAGSKSRLTSPRLTRDDAASTRVFDRGGSTGWGSRPRGARSPLDLGSVSISVSIPIPTPAPIRPGPLRGSLRESGHLGYRPDRLTSSRRGSPGLPAGVRARSSGEPDSRAVVGGDVRLPFFTTAGDGATPRSIATDGAAALIG